MWGRLDLARKVANATVAKLKMIKNLNVIGWAFYYIFLKDMLACRKKMSNGFKCKYIRSKE